MVFSFSSCSIPDVLVIEPKVFGDERGFFMETYHKTDFQNGGILCEFVQDNHSKSNKGVLRGLHFQTEHTQSKLVRVVVGAVYDVVVDLRKDLPSYGKWFGVVLSSQNKKQLFVPKGFAHGFLTLEDNTEFFYKCDDFYDPQSEGGIFYSDRDLNINRNDIMQEYGIEQLILSEKDKIYPTMQEFYAHNPF